MTWHQGTNSVAAKRVSALILAAGDGLRLGLGPKAFLQAFDKTLLERAVDAVAPFADEIIVGIRPADIERAAVLVGDRCTILAGGKTRQGTLSRLLKIASREFCLIHEVARPFVTPELFDSVLRAAGEHNAAALFVPIPVRDSLTVMEDGFAGQALPREKVVSMQTPHAYKTSLLREIHQEADRGGYIEDSTAALVARAGVKLKLVAGSDENIKVTYKQDWPAYQDQRASSNPLDALFNSPIVDLPAAAQLQPPLKIASAAK